MFSALIDPHASPYHDDSNCKYTFRSKSMVSDLCNQEPGRHVTKIGRFHQLWNCHAINVEWEAAQIVAWYRSLTSSVGCVINLSSTGNFTNKIYFLLANIFLKLTHYIHRHSDDRAWAVGGMPTWDRELAVHRKVSLAVPSSCWFQVDSCCRRWAHFACSSHPPKPLSPPIVVDLSLAEDFRLEPVVVRASPGAAPSRTHYRNNWSYKVKKRKKNINEITFCTFGRKGVSEVSGRQSARMRAKLIKALGQYRI